MGFVMVRAVLIAAVLGSTFAPAVTAGAEPDPLLAEGFELAYNLDHDAAVERFRQAILARPDDPAPYRGLAATAWLRIVFLRGGLLVDPYLAGTVTRPAGPDEDPPDDLVRTFEEHVERAIDLAEAAIRRTPDDANAHYELGVAVGLAASYQATIDRQPIRALRQAKRAYEAHERVLELDPSRDDAKLLIGIYRYVVSLLPRAVRMVAYLVGFDGGKAEAIELVEAAAAYPGDTRSEAQFALVLLANRERDYRSAHRVLRQLQRAYPRNRLVWLETASTWLRADQPAMAERMLDRGFSLLQGDDRTRMFGEDAIWHLKRGTVRAAMGRLDAARVDLTRAATATAPPWVQGRAHLELGKIADLSGDRRLARDHYDEGRDLCGDARDRSCERAADRFRDTPYRGAPRRP